MKSAFSTFANKWKCGYVFIPTFSQHLTWIWICKAQLKAALPPMKQYPGYSRIATCDLGRTMKAWDWVPKHLSKMQRTLFVLVFSTLHYFCTGTWCDFDQKEASTEPFPCQTWSRPKASDGKIGFKVLNNATVNQEKHPQVKDSLGRNVGKIFCITFIRGHPEISTFSTWIWDNVS